VAPNRRQKRKLENELVLEGTVSYEKSIPSYRRDALQFGRKSFTYLPNSDFLIFSTTLSVMFICYRHNCIFANIMLRVTTNDHK
jgi:hypothetical protein